jgi:DNA repair protein RecO (recombination protein O)
MSDREAVLLERGFVLHHRPYRNSSLLVDCLTEGYGRIGLVAQGSRRTATGQRALLQPFLPLRLSWIRRGELGRLTQVEAASGPLELSGTALLAGFYVNELMLRLLQRGDRNEAIYSCYSSCVLELSARTRVSRSLRLFELALLEALGYGVELGRDVHTGEPLRPDAAYVFEPEAGPARREARAAEEQFSGRDLISLRDRALNDPDSLRAAKRLLGGILRTHLGERPLKSREVMKEIYDGGFEP